MTEKTEQLDEFQASFGDPSMVPGPVATKSNKRPADKDQGEKAMPTLSKSAMVAQMMQKLTGMNKDGVASAYGTMFGKSAAAGGGSAKNMATVKGMKEDVEEIFGDEELTEEFKERAETVFTAAVTARVAAEVARIEEEYEAKLVAEKEELEKTLTDKVDTYVTYAAEEWVKQNEVAIESAIKVEMAESFLNGLKGLFEQHNVVVDDEKLDLVSEANAKTEQLEEQLNEAVKSKLDLQKEIESLKREKMVGEASASLTMTQQEKLRSMAEGIEYETLEDFAKKLDVIKETYFASKSVVTEQVDEEPLDEAEEKAALDPLMEHYASAISRTVKR